MYAAEGQNSTYTLWKKTKTLCNMALIQEWDQVTELNQLELFLRQPDAVMEPNIMEKLRQYVAKGGSPRDVVEMLTDSYVGKALAGCTALPNLLAPPISVHRP